LLVYLRRLRRSTAALRENENKFIDLFQRSPLPLALVHRASRQLIEVNDAWLQLFGFTAPEVLHRTADEINLWVDPQARQQTVDYLDSHGYVVRQDALLRRRDGQTMCCVVTGRVIESAGQSCALYSSLDVTAQRQMALELQGLNQELEQRVQQRTESLAQSNRELVEALASLKAMQTELIRSEKMAALGSLVAGVAHELNTPIGTSFTVASALQDQTRHLQRAVQAGGLRRSVFEQYLFSAAQGVDILMSTLRRAVDLIGSFKGVAVDQSSDQRRVFDLRQMLQDLLLTLQPMCRKTPFVLSADLAGGIELDSYPGAIGQVVTNCVTNALMHAFEGRARGHMQLRTRLLDDDQLEIAFSDDGIGMSDAVLRRVFDPFFTTKFGQGGSGLGMHIVYKLVTDVLGGAIRLDSALDRGLRIVVVLPRVAPRVRSQADSTS
jgi:PAS domain S-box-containing protein